MTPVEASKEENENKVRRTLYDPPERNTPKFSVGDKVRIARKKGIFEKGYTPKWTEEIFTNIDVFSRPICRKILKHFLFHGSVPPFNHAGFFFVLCAV